MARIWSSGFELNSLTADMELSSSSDSPSIQTTTKRSGNYALEILNPTSSVFKGVSYIYSASTSDGPWYFRFYLYIATLPNATTRIFRVGGAGTHPIKIDLLTNGTLTLNDEDGQIGSASSALSLNTWYRIESMYSTVGGAGAGIVEALIDGISFASASNRNSAKQNTVAYGVNLGNSGTASSGNWFFDDLAINDSSGSIQNSYPGAGSIVHIHPDGDGDTNNSSGTFADIDEETPDDATTIATLDVDNDIIDVTCQSSSSVGIAANDTVNLIQVGSRQRAASTATATYKLRIKSASGGTLQEGTLINNASTNYSTHLSSSPHNYTLTSYIDPTTGLAWTPTGTNSLDNMQIGMQATDATPDVNLSTLWALVEYQPAGPPTPSVSDSIAVSESLSSYSDNIFIRENYSVAIIDDAYLINETEDISVTESANVLIPFLNISVSENIGVAENLDRMLESYIVKSEAISVAESVSRLLESYVSKSESISVNESVGRLLESNVNKSESISVAESIGRLLESNVNKSESVSVTENVSLLIATGISVSDSIGVTESIGRMVESYINESESVSVAESASLQFAYGIAVSDSIIVNESIAFIITPVFINVSENITLAESTSFAITPLFLTFTEAIAVNESVRLRVQLITTDSIMALKVEDEDVTPLTSDSDSITGMH